MDILEIENTKTKINEFIKEGLYKNIIQKSEGQAMSPKDKNVGRFYCIFKVHKPHKPKQVPPEQPILSHSGSKCEKLKKL